jgi:hypothetical protein
VTASGVPMVGPVPERAVNRDTDGGMCERTAPAPVGARPRIFGRGPE